MITLTSDAVNRGTYPLLISFTDSNGDETIPTSVTWSLTDQYGNIVNDREDISITPDSSFYIVLTGDDIDIENESSRYLTIDTVYDSTLYGSNLAGREQAKFEIGEWVEPEATS